MNETVESHRFPGYTEWRLPPYKWDLEDIISLRHRLDGPAVINDSGMELWYRYGALHRIGGPAVTFKKTAGHKLLYTGESIQTWFLRGIRYSTFKKYCKAVKDEMTEEDYLLMLLTYNEEE